MSDIAQIAILIGVFGNIILTGYFVGRYSQKVDNHEDKHKETTTTLKEHDGRIRAIEVNR